MTAEDVKAKDYFKCVRLGDSKYLNCKDHESVFVSLQDEFFLLRDNGEDKSDLRTHQRIELIKYQISVLSLAKSIYQHLPLDDERREKVEGNIKQIGFKFKDRDNAKQVETDFISWFGQLKNEIQLAELNLLNKGNEKQDFNYSQVIVAFESIVERSINEDISLAKFAAYEKEANIRLRKLKEQNNK